MQQAILEVQNMIRATAVALALALSSSLALADTPVKEADAAKITEALKAVGCEGGKMEQETEASGVFEVDDAKCKDGQFDFKLDKDFKILGKSAD
jgi:hypothetical protein